MRTPHSWRSLSLMGERKDVQGSWDFPRLAALNFLSFSFRELHASIMSQSYFCKMCRKIYLRIIFGEASRNLSFNLLSAPSNRSRFIQSYLFRNSTRSWVVQSDGSCRLYRYLWKPRSSLEVSREKETLYLLRETNKSFSEPYFRLKRARRHAHTLLTGWYLRDTRRERRGSRVLFQSIPRVETNSAKLVDSIISSRLENSSPSSSPPFFAFFFLFRFRHTFDTGLYLSSSELWVQAAV